ncbi:MAG: hypothetical protein K0U86_11590 [Planctomycetes bacterium]|nr:hypothetical protein [Planctomycetota bacterium]MCH9725526.1 hypothetical protein [Planctomycetota bacterium]MCH9776481.1 hypothetical protein [Planctomycetota bacterium]MCH9791082.1 hypothetical protein [Planctomycetota bacterium]
MKRRRFCISIKQHGIPPGISLVEVVVAMGIATILLGISMTTMHTVMRAERETSKAAWLGSSFHRFSRLIRSDIHAATSLEFLEGSTQSSPELTIKKTDAEIVKYRIEGHRIFRVVTRNEQQVHQDGFFLPEGSHAYFFERKRLNQAGIAIDEPLHAKNSLKQGRTAVKNSELKSSHRELEIISTIGHDYRLADMQIKPTKKETK